MSKQRGSIIQRLEQELERNELGGDTSSAGYLLLLKKLKS